MMHRSSPRFSRDRFRPAVEPLEDRTAPTAAGWAIDVPASNLGLAIDGQNNSYVSGGGTYLMRLSAPHGAALGTVSADLNDNGRRDAEPPLVGWTVYADLNGNGVFDPGEPSAI